MNISYPRIIHRPPQTINMSTSRLVRGTKSRFFLYVCAFAAFVLVIYVFHGSQKQIEESQKSAAMCLQQQESLSAQLQVIFEYKLRLEKSLQKEKSDHKTTREECLSRAQEEKAERERENLETQNKYNALQQYHKLLQSQHKDLTEECSKIRKEKNEEKSHLEKMLSAVKLEMQQTSAAKEKSLETMKSRFMKLEVDKERLQRENEELKKEKLPESAKVVHLEKLNAQLESELSEVKKKLISCNGVGDQSNKDQKKSSVGAVNVDQYFGAEPPKMNPTGNNLSTTPGINPEAINEHDASLKPIPSKSLQFTPSKVTANLKRPTQSAALPIQVPANQEDPQVKDIADAFNFEINRHQIPAEEEKEPVPIPQVPETNVINKPDLLEKQEQKKDDLNEENQGGEVVQEVPGPMNPIQNNEVAPNMAPFHKFMENKRLGNHWDTNKDNHGFVGRRTDLNGAHEEGDEEVAPIPQHNWRLDDGKVLPRQMKHEYQGGDYDKEPPEEEEDEEGEQLDYIGAEPGLKHAKQMAKLRQQLENNGAGIMVNPK